MCSVFAFIFTWGALWSGLAAFHPETPSGICWKHCRLQCVNVWALRTSLWHTPNTPQVHSHKTDVKIICICDEIKVYKCYRKRGGGGGSCRIWQKLPIQSEIIFLNELLLCTASVNLLLAQRCEQLHSGDKLKECTWKMQFKQLWIDSISYKIHFRK